MLYRAKSNIVIRGMVTFLTKIRFIKKLISAISASLLLATLLSSNLQPAHSVQSTEVEISTESACRVSLAHVWKKFE